MNNINHFSTNKNWILGLDFHYGSSNAILVLFIKTTALPTSWDASHCVIQESLLCQKVVSQVSW